MIRLQRLGPDEGPRLRAIRLRALRDAPDAFASTLEEAAARTSEKKSDKRRGSGNSFPDLPATAILPARLEGKNHPLRGWRVAGREGSLCPKF